MTKPKRKTKRMWAAVNPAILHRTKAAAKAIKCDGDIIVPVSVPTKGR